MSTRVQEPPRSKKFSCWVRPGVCDVRASVFLPVSALTRLDLPTFERPAKGDLKLVHRRKVVDATGCRAELRLAGEKLAPGLHEVRAGLGVFARVLVAIVLAHATLSPGSGPLI